MSGHGTLPSGRKFRLVSLKDDNPDTTKCVPGFFAKAKIDPFDFSSEK
jgi:hypothetical protein